MKNINKYEVIKEIKASMSDNAIDFTDEYFGYSGNAYISDLFHEFADNHTSIYYYDIIKYISEHVEDVSRTIDEFGWDGCGADLYKAGQTAQFQEIFMELESDRDNIITLYVLYMLPDEMPSDMWEYIESEIDVNADRLPEADEIQALIDEWIEEHAESITEAIDRAAGEVAETVKEWILTCSKDGIDIDHEEVIKSDTEPDFWTCQNIATHNACDFWTLQEA